MRRVAKICLLAAAALSLAVSPAAAASGQPADFFAPASARGVTEFPVGATRISSLTQLGDGTILFRGGTGTREHLQPRLGRVGQSGPLGEVATTPVQDLVTSGDGSTWGIVEDSGNQSWVGRATALGSWEQIAGTKGTMSIGASAKGGVWFLQSDRFGNYGPEAVPKAGFVSPTGQVTAFPIPYSELGTGAIVEGKEGDAWFTEAFLGRIVRISPSGELKEFPLPPGSKPTEITADDAGNLWFTEPEQNRIGRITPSGQITEFDLPHGVIPASIAAGRDGRIWFSEWASPEPTALSGGVGHLGRITPTGRFTQVRLPNHESFPESLIAGSEGALWFTAMGENTFCGGGGSCLMWEPWNPAIVGGVAPTQLKTVTMSGPVTVGRRGVKVPVACEGGDAWNHCRGQITVKGGGRKLATARYSLEADQAKELVVAFAPGIRSPLGEHGSLAATVAIVATAGKGSREKVSLTRSARPKR